jgi:hypothetical protein
MPPHEEYRTPRQVIDSLRAIYTEKMLPIEEAYKFGEVRPQGCPCAALAHSRGWCAFLASFSAAGAPPPSAADAAPRAAADAAPSPVCVRGVCA